VPITSGTLLLKESGGERTAALETGVAYFRKASVGHDVINGGDAEVVFVEVEILG
jgi:oxalate decarboxylase/phosphoglucose isomerase-like protein (cupin superfamily)